MSHVYSWIPGDEQDHFKQGAKSNKGCDSVLKLLLVLIICSCTGFGGYWVGRKIINENQISSALTGVLDVDTIATTFHYNRNFSYPPSQKTNGAWDAIFPTETFFEHETVAPILSTFSMFHQLHCLNAVWKGYFANQQAAANGRIVLDEDLPPGIRVGHMRHCIDYLRQSLMCHADTTLEVMHDKVNGVHGFGTKHECRSWDQIKQWTAEQNGP